MITIFTKDGCPFCVKAKNLLDGYDIKYLITNVTENKAGMKFIKEAGHTTVPQIYNNFDLLVEGGYNGLAELSKEEIMEKCK